MSLLRRYTTALLSWWQVVSLLRRVKELHSNSLITQNANTATYRKHICHHMKPKYHHTKHILHKIVKYHDIKTRHKTKHKYRHRKQIALNKHKQHLTKHRYHGIKQMPPHKTDKHHHIKYKYHQIKHRICITIQSTDFKT